MATPVTGLVMEKSRKIVSFVMGAPLAMSRCP